MNFHKHHLGSSKFKNEQPVQATPEESGGQGEEQHCKFSIHIADIWTFQPIQVSNFYFNCASY